MDEGERDFSWDRANMVAEQIERRGIRDAAVLRALQTIPREKFVLPAYRNYAYDDTPLPIPAGQTISQPYVVALMLQALKLTPTDRVLEIGTGSGYAAALLSRIAAEVYTIERISELVAYARERLSSLKCKNIHICQGDGSLGWPEFAPFEAIIVAAGGPFLPPALKQQLAPGGRLVMPVGRKQRKQELIRVTRINMNSFQQVNLGAVAFVPLVGAMGWGIEDN